MTKTLQINYVLIIFFVLLPSYTLIKLDLLLLLLFTLHIRNYYKDLPRKKRKLKFIHF